VESEVVQLKESTHPDHSTTTSSVAPAVTSSSSACTVSDNEVSSAADSSNELSGAVPVSLQCLVTSSASLDVHTVESFRSNESNHLSSTSVAVKVAEMCPVQLHSSPESSTNLSKCSEEISLSCDSQFDSQKWTDVSFWNCRNTSSSSLTETSSNRHAKAAGNLSRKRRHDDEILECGRLTFDKVPNYYTALSIPTRVMAGSAARSSSDLVKDFMCSERDPSPERKSCSVFDKLPAYYSSFTNSTRYDDLEHTTDANFHLGEVDAEVRYGRSHELLDFTLADESPVESSCAENDQQKEETNTENVSYFVFPVFWWRGSVVERRSLAGELSLSCARPAADG